MAEDTTPQRDPDWRAAAAIADARLELAAVRTGLALERTRLSADRTLMAVMRTALGLIGLGAGIFEYVYFSGGSVLSTARYIGFALVGLGLGVLGPGIVSHGVFLHRLRRQRRDLALRGLVPPALDLPGSVANGLAVLLFLLGAVSVARMILSIT